MESLAIYNMLAVKNSSSNIAFFNYNEILAIVNFGNIFLTKYASLMFFKEVSASERKIAVGHEKNYPKFWLYPCTTILTNNFFRMPSVCSSIARSHAAQHNTHIFRSFMSSLHAPA